MDPASVDISLKRLTGKTRMLHHTCPSYLIFQIFSLIARISKHYYEVIIFGTIIIKSIFLVSSTFLLTIAYFSRYLFEEKKLIGR